MIPAMRRTIARLVLRAARWKWPDQTPEGRKFVLIAAPHTSAWDFVFLKLVCWAIDLPISWFGKHTLFHFPYGWIMRAWGGVPVDRRSPQNLVQQLVAEFERRESFILVVPPEGTRKRVEHWKSGFYHIARLAQVPILLGCLEFERREGSFGGPVLPSDDMTKDMDFIRAYYRDKKGEHPERFGPIRLREEGE